jgi:hypothetical protein
MNIQVIENDSSTIVIPEAHTEIFNDPVDFRKWIDNQIEHFAKHAKVQYGAVIFDNNHRTWKLTTITDWMQANVDGRDHFFMQMNGLVTLLLTFPDTDTMTRFVLENGDK